MSVSDERLNEIADWFDNKGRLGEPLWSKELCSIFRELLLRRRECEAFRSGFVSGMAEMVQYSPPEYKSSRCREAWEECRDRFVGKLVAMKSMFDEARRATDDEVGK
jgi:hypothetical protein